MMVTKQVQPKPSTWGHNDVAQNMKSLQINWLGLRKKPLSQRHPAHQIPSSMAVILNFFRAHELQVLTSSCILILFSLEAEKCMKKLSFIKFIPFGPFFTARMKTLLRYTCIHQQVVHLIKETLKAPRT